jgi:hypothetical protein
MLIDCEQCEARDTDACNGCIVTFLLDRDEGAVVFDVAEERAIRTLQDGGLVAGTNYLPRAAGR